MDNSEERKLRVGILFGGKSAEHEVSLQSAKNIIEALDKKRFEPVLIGIGKDGSWHTAPALDGTTSTMLEATILGKQHIVALPGNERRELHDIQSGTPLPALDVVFPVLHGTFGEDGTVQGLLELANLPYVGPGVLGSAVGMDKDIMKRLLRDAGIGIAPFVTVQAYERSSVDPTAIMAKLGKTLFVKPANLGSSVGVSKVTDEAELLSAIDEALRYDTKILIETALDGDEIECAVLGNDHPKASVVGKIIPRAGDFYSYEAKYLDENGAQLEIPATLPPHVSEAARATAIRTFQTLACEGMARVDMFATKDGKIVVNEINTIPGFTKISMYPKLWEATGIAYTELITQLIDLALERFAKHRRLETSR